MAKQVCILPFKDQSEFKSPWNLGKGVQKYIASYLSEYTDVVDVDTLSGYLRSKGWRHAELQKEAKVKNVAKKTGSRFLITGKITKFYVIKKMVGNGKLGGYKHYNAGIEMKVMVFDASAGQWTDQFPVSIHERNIGIRINLPAKLSKDEEYFHRLSEEPFGSEVFKETVAGKVMDKASQIILEKLNHPKKSWDPPAVVKKPKKIFEGKVLTVADSTVYVNLGQDDSIVVGDRFPVFTNGAPIIDPEKGDTLGFTDQLVGEVEIIFIKARHLCSAKITETKGKIQPGDRVRVSK